MDVDGRDLEREGAGESTRGRERERERNREEGGGEVWLFIVDCDLHPIHIR